MEREDDVPVFRKRIMELLDADVREESNELLDLLGAYWTAMGTEFRTKMEPWKAHRIYDISWTSPVIEFRIERHPSAWNRVQRWAYDFDSDEATIVSEWSPPENPRYTKQQVHEDAQQIVNALVSCKSHPCLEKKGEYFRIWVGRLPQTKPVAYLLPQRTAKGRQARLKAQVSQLIEKHPEFVRATDKETTGSLVYRCLQNSQPTTQL